MLYANFPMRSTLIPISQAFRDDSPASRGKSNRGR
jgi:hypothetical protein